jgi:hypothetical protein
MASPAWFFSTLAQASAAIIALTIAFTITSYSTRREYIQDRSDRFREKLIRYQEQYQGIMDNMARTIKDEVDIDYDSVRFDLVNDDPESWADNQDNPDAALFWAYLSGVGGLLADVDPALGPSIEDEELGAINNAARNLAPLIDTGTDSSEEIYKAVTGSDDVPDDYYTVDFLEEGRKVEAWLARNLTERYENQSGVCPGEMPTSGKNFYSWGKLLEQFRLDTKILTGRTPATELTDFMNPEFAGRVVITVFQLAIVGVFLPTLFLISSPAATVPSCIADLYTWLPAWLRNWSIYILQGGLLFLSAMYTRRLFSLMTKQLNYRPASTMAQLLGVEGEGNGEDEDVGPEEDQETS